MKTPFAIRPFRLTEMPQILQIEKLSFGRYAWDRNLFAAYARHPRSIFLVARGRKGIAGYSISRWKEERAELSSIAVDPQVRGRGVASSLLRSTIRRLKLRGTRRLTLMVKVTNRSARRFYEGHGFAPVRVVRGYYEDGKDAILMGRNL